MNALALTTLLLGLVVGLVVGYFLAARQSAGQQRFLLGRVRELESARESDHDLAMSLAPLTSSLARVERRVEGMEKERAAQVGALSAQIGAVQAAGEALNRQTSALAGALNSTTVRGSWGEVQLRRVVEHAGMLAQVDFDTQVSGTNDEGADVRPDAVVRLPGGKQVVVDAKAPMQAFLQAARQPAVDEDPAHAAKRRATAAAEHAKALRRHVDTLAAKRYWTAFTPTPEMVVCFVPGESFLAAACEADPALLEHAMGRKVVLATPSTLLALLRTVAAAWQQDALAAGARELLDVGKELYCRISGLSEQLTRLGRSLDRAVGDYNATLGTLERRVLVSARRMHGLGLDEAPLPEIPTLQTPTRRLTATEFVTPAPTEAQPPQETTAPSGGARPAIPDAASRQPEDSAFIPGQTALFEDSSPGASPRP